MIDKIREIAQKAGVPAELLIEVIDLERERITLKNRRLTPRILEVISKYAEESSESVEESE